MKTREQVVEILREIKNLPTLPAVATRAMTMTEDPNCSQIELANVVEQDPAIATRLLKLVNSPFYGIRGTVDNVKQALIFVGMSNVRNLVLSTSVLELFDDDGKVGSFDRKDLWLHSMATAITARTAAQVSRVVDPEVAFTAGLIHDVGKLIIDRFFHEDFKRIIELVDMHHCTMMDAENAVLGTNHSEIGAHLAQRWGLPDALREAIGYHHDPQQAQTNKPLAALVGFADVLARDLKVGTGGGTTPQLTEHHLTLSKMSSEDLTELRRHLADDIEERVSQIAAL